MYKEIKRVFSAKCLKAELQVLLFQTKQICLSTFSAGQVGGGPEKQGSEQRKLSSELVDCF